MNLLTFSLLLLLSLSALPSVRDYFPKLDDYNVVWDSPSKDALGSMPLGNGDITLNLWVEGDGDLLFYIGKSDAWDEYNRLLKLGKVRISLSPNPFQRGGKFRQELVLRRGEIVIQATPPKSSNLVELHIWVDANHPVIHITIESKQPLTATASFELWRTKPTPLTSFEVSDIYNACPNPPPVIIEPDVIIRGQPDGIGWLHFNRKSEGPKLTMDFQDILEAPWHDPLLNRAFGAFIRAHGDYKKVDDQHIQSPNKTHHLFSIYVLSEQPSSPKQWLLHIRELIKKIEAIDLEKRRREHIAWWEAFWERSWIFIKDRGTFPRKPVAPANEHPLKIGIDQAGGSSFSGEIARLSILKKVLSPEDIRELVKGRREPLKGKDVLVSLSNPRCGAVVELKPEELPYFTCEGWIKVSEDDKGGRILDKITPGGSDGFLLDTWPGKSLRLIVGERTISRENVLRPGVWHHIACVLTPDKMQVYLDGEFICGDKNPPGYDVSLGYILQRFITACAGRGAYPIKFNGSLFVMPWPGCPNDADYRRWGPGYWWQNTRLPYMSACANGDFDIMQPLFNMYAGEVFEVCKYRTRRYFGFEGAYYPECIYPWGAVFMDTYGWEKPAREREDKLQNSLWHKYEWVGGLELAYMMLEYYEYTLDERFLQEKVIPLAYQLLLFFNNFYKTGPNGKLMMEPSQALETWWDCRNPMPEVAGLQAITSRLLALPEGKLPPRIREFLEEFRKKIPPLPLREVEGVKMLAPAERFAHKSNVENPELYAVFPFRLVSFEKTNAELGIQALKHRLDRGNFGWRQDDIFMAYLGLAQEAKEYIVGRARTKNPLCRFPAFWGPNYDWTPDQDHGGVLMKALQAMLIQTEGRKIYLFPAWPKEWDVHFKLHAPYRTVVEGKLVGGKLVDLKVAPEERRKDIVLLEPQ